MSVQGALRDSPADGMSRADGDVKKSRRLLASSKPRRNSRRSSFVIRSVFIADAEPLCTPGRSPGRVKLGDLRVGEDEIRILSFHVQLQRAFARWRIMEPFANSHAREITAGHVDRAAAMCQSGERRSLNSVRRPGEIDRPCFGSRWLRPGGGGGRPGKYSATKSRIADKLSGGPLQIGRKGLLGWRWIVDMNAPPRVCHNPPILARSPGKYAELASAIRCLREPHRLSPNLVSTSTPKT